MFHLGKERERNAIYTADLFRKEKKKKK